MIKTQITVLTNNTVNPFQNYGESNGINFVEMKKYFASQLLAEHGLGFLVFIDDGSTIQGYYKVRPLKQIIFDTGSVNQTFMHNLRVLGYSIYSTNYIVLSHWHYDHTGGLYKILEAIDKKIPIITHEYARYERFFNRSETFKTSDLAGKSRDELEPLLDDSKIVNQDPIDVKRIESMKAKVVYSKDLMELYSSDELKVLVSGEIPRTHPEEEFKNFFLLKIKSLEPDTIPDDKCLILEYRDHVILLNGCCHSGLMNTLDYVKGITSKPITHIIGGFHMADASKERINVTIKYLETLQQSDKPLYLFPLHCIGENFFNELKKLNLPNIKAFNISVGTNFYF